MKSLNEKTTFELIKMIDDDHIATELMRRYNQPQPKTHDTLMIENRVIELERQLEQERSK